MNKITKLIKMKSKYQERVKELVRMCVYYTNEEIHEKMCELAEEVEEQQKTESYKKFRESVQYLFTREQVEDFAKERYEKSLKFVENRSSVLTTTFQVIIVEALKIAAGLESIKDLQRGTFNANNMVKSALIESKKLLDFYIESKDDLNTEQIESVKHFIKALRAGCGCDAYNAFDCGCGNRAFLVNEALKELEGSTFH